MRSNPTFSKTVCFLLLVLVLLSSCSALRLGYRNGETVVYWWLNGYVDFETEQQPWVRRHIDDLFAWHRKTQLKDYARLLAGVQQQIQHTVTPSDVAATHDAVEKRSLLVIEQAIPALADLALALQPHQIAHLAKKFASNNDNYRKEYLRGDVDKRQLIRFKKMMKQAEYWFGDFSEEQVAELRAASDARPLNYDLGLEMRIKRQQELIALLQRIQAQQPSREVTMDMLRDFVQASMQQFGVEQHRAFVQDSRESAQRLVATTINLATPKQKERAAGRLQQWIDDCNKLAAKGA